MDIEAKNWTGNDLRLTGSSSATGGRYDKVRIVGDAVITGDITCSELKCVGTLNTSGSLEAGNIKVIGTCATGASIQVRTMKLTGTLSIEGDAGIGRLGGSGEMDVRGSLNGGLIELRGRLAAGENCEVEVFRPKGLFEIGGLLNAGEIDVKLYRDSSAKEIGGGKIAIRKASIMNPLSLFFRPSLNASLTASIVEGDDIYLEHTRADVVRGIRVTIGAGCEIGLVEYRESLHEKQGAKIGEKRRL